MDLQQEMGMSIIFITHDLGVVAELCSRVLVMYGGMVMEEALIDDIFHRPRHPYTMGLLASIPNIKQDKSQRLTPIPGFSGNSYRRCLPCPGSGHTAQKKKTDGQQHRQGCRPNPSLHSVFSSLPVSHPAASRCHKTIEEYCRCKKFTAETAPEFQTKPAGSAC